MAKRKWTIPNDERYDTEDAFRAAVAEELARHEHVGYRIGLAIVASPLRRRLPDGEIQTLGWVFRTETTPLLSDEQIARADEDVLPEPEQQPWEPEEELSEEPVDAEPVTVPEGDPYAEDQ